jgi:hypothetical protein
LAKYSKVFDIIYLVEDGHRRRFKLKFRGAMAYRWYERKSSYEIFDTTDNTESEIGDGMTHFVMDLRGRIYAGYTKGDETWFKHSSLVGGSPVLAAGRLRAEQGRIVFIQNDSGHYKPDHQQMRNVLQRLELYGQLSGNIVICRQSDKKKFRGSDVMRSLGGWPKDSLALN